MCRTAGALAPIARSSAQQRMIRFCGLSAARTPVSCRRALPLLRGTGCAGHERWVVPVKSGLARAAQVNVTRGGSTASSSSRWPQETYQPALRHKKKSSPAVYGRTRSNQVAETLQSGGAAQPSRDDRRRTGQPVEEEPTERLPREPRQHWNPDLQASSSDQCAPASVTVDEPARKVPVIGCLPRRKIVPSGEGGAMAKDPALRKSVDFHVQAWREGDHIYVAGGELDPIVVSNREGSSAYLPAHGRSSTAS
jgi:hypothetical protein